MTPREAHQLYTAEFLVHSGIRMPDWDGDLNPHGRTAFIKVIETMNREIETARREAAQAKQQLDMERRTLRVVEAMRPQTWNETETDALRRKLARTEQQLAKERRTVAGLQAIIEPFRAEVARLTREVEQLQKRFIPPKQATCTRLPGGFRSLHVLLADVFARHTDPREEQAFVCESREQQDEVRRLLTESSTCD